MIDSIAIVLASLLPRNLCTLQYAKSYLPNHLVSQGVTATPVDEVEHAEDEQHHEEIILADRDILLWASFQRLYDIPQGQLRM
jgi:hypothetical protein